MSSLIRGIRFSARSLKCLRLKHHEDRLLRFPANLDNRGLSMIQKRFCSSTELSLGNPVVRKYLDRIVNEYKKVKRGENDDSVKIDKLRPLMGLLEERLKINENLSSLDELVGQDEEMKSLAEEERSIYKTRLAELEEELLEMLLENAGRDDCSDVVFEITAGVGGQEAMLFARELWQMYMGYMDYLGYDCSVTEHDVTELGGTRHATALISGAGAFEKLRHEAGVHRVQRIPSTEKSGRVHTSTVSVAILPQPTDIQVSLKDKDLKIETKRATGAGGQHVNSTDSAVRIVHLPSGTAVECQVERSQLRNKESALRTLRARIYERQLTEQQSSAEEMRRSQKGLGQRNEKIRTYNYNQDRVTDHRLANGTLHNLKGFLEGGNVLDELHKRLQKELQRRTLLEAIGNVKA